jgi:hypothetical protein
MTISAQCFGAVCDVQAQTGSTVETRALQVSQVSQVSDTFVVDSATEMAVWMSKQEKLYRTDDVAPVGGKTSEYADLSVRRVRLVARRQPLATMRVCGINRWLT